MTLERNPKKPTFAQTRKLLLDMLSDAGWIVNRDLKIPTATAPHGLFDMCGNSRVVLLFKPQALYCEVRGQFSQRERSLTSDIRDITTPARAIPRIDPVEQIEKWVRDYLSFEEEPMPCASS